MKNTLHVIKIGGNVIDNPQALSGFLSGLASLQGAKILIHGGGNAAGRLAARLGIPQQMAAGRRITDAATLEVVTMVYAGLINKSLVAALQALRCNAAGFSGADCGLVLSSKRNASEINYGFAGDVLPGGVDAAQFDRFLTAGITPVICPLTHDGKGQLLNTNADTMAAEIARAMAALYEVELRFCFEKKGILADVSDEHSVLPELNYGAYLNLRGSGKIHSGMIPKLDNAFKALDSGVKSVWIGASEAVFLEQKNGTLLKTI